MSHPRSFLGLLFTIYHMIEAAVRLRNLITIVTAVVNCAVLLAYVGQRSCWGWVQRFLYSFEYFFKQKQTIANNMFNCILGMCLAHLPARLCLGICEEGRGEEVRSGCGKGWRAHFSAPGCHPEGIHRPWAIPIQIYSDHVDRGEQSSWCCWCKTQPGWKLWWIILWIIYGTAQVHLWILVDVEMERIRHQRGDLAVIATPFLASSCVCEQMGFLASTNYRVDRSLYQHLSTLDWLLDRISIGYCGCFNNHAYIYIHINIYI